MSERGSGDPPLLRDSVQRLQLSYWVLALFSVYWGENKRLNK